MKFGVQKAQVFGTAGEFTVGHGASALRARFVLTKIRPGSDGDWENELASQMVPWREVFSIEELSFDELLQRDLDDSRVAYKLIPYLLGPDGAAARFFPPILAVIVPRKAQGTGIERLYPVPSVDTPHKQSFGELFDFTTVFWPTEDGQPQATPLSELRYNRQRSAFVIVDGQHRAMAVLALHRQITDGWGNNPFASYYAHVQVTPAQVAKVELPVCLVYFPDLHADSPIVKDRGLDLLKVCRELFVIVNQTAKPVSKSRELLLDDVDFAALLMRRTLSNLKNRGEDDAGVARIYSFDYGDSDEDRYSRTGLIGHMVMSSAVALHRLHCAISFGNPKAFRFDSPADVSDGRQAANPDRPAEVLLGTTQSQHNTVSRRHGRAMSPSDTAEIVGLLGDHADAILLPFFDRLRPYTLHSRELRGLRTRLRDVNARADLIQQKCFNLMFEGSGARSIFESHMGMLREQVDFARQEGRSPSDYMIAQLKFCESVQAALDRYDKEIRLRRAALYFGIDPDAFLKTVAADPEGHRLQQRLEEAGRSVFQTVSTQAFQLGFVMAVLSAAEPLVHEKAYPYRVRMVGFISRLLLAGLNAYLAPPPNEPTHKTLTGFIDQSRAMVFHGQHRGLRGLFAMSVPELKESFWTFFRYVVLELAHSRYGVPALAEVLNDPEAAELASAYRARLPELMQFVVADRRHWIERAVKHQMESREFQQHLNEMKAEAKGAGMGEVEIEQLLQERRREKEDEVRQLAHANVKASLYSIETPEEMAGRL